MALHNTGKLNSKPTCAVESDALSSDAQSYVFPEFSREPETVYKTIHDQLVLDQFDSLHAEHVGVANGFDSLECCQFLAEFDIVGCQFVVTSSRDELHGLVKAAGSFTFPDFTESTTSQGFNKHIPRKRFHPWLFCVRRRS